MEIDLPRLMREQGVKRKRVRIQLVRPRAALVRELEAINEAALAKWIEGADRIISAYRAPGRTGFKDSADDTSRLIELLVLQTNGLMVGFAARIKNWAGRVERVQRSAWIEGVLAATSINLGTILSPLDVAETVEASIARNTALIRGVSDSVRGRVADIVFRGVQQRTPTAQVAKQIREAVDIERRRAKRIASDQTVKLHAALNRARQEEAGLTHFIWRHSGKANPRKPHVARDGILYKWNAKTKGPGRKPPPSNDMPGMPPYCGCQPQAVILDENGRPI